MANTLVMRSLPVPRRFCSSIKNLSKVALVLDVRTQHMQGLVKPNADAIHCSGFEGAWKRR
jgi:hypothetical protein